MDATNRNQCSHRVFGLPKKVCWALLAAGASLVLTGGSPLSAQSLNATYEKDPTTGEMYAKSVRTVQRSVVDTVLEPQQQVIYRPQTVTETTPRLYTLYTPVTEVKWRMYRHGWWNIFRPPTHSYHPVAETHWERRSQVINHTTSKVSYVPETRTVQVAKQVPRIETQQIVSYQKVTPPAASQPSTRIEGISEAVAARLRPMSNDEVLMASQRGNTRPSGSVASYPRTISRAMPLQTQVAAASVGRIDSDPPRRSTSQSGMRANDLLPSTRVIGQPLAPTNIATFPGTIFR